GPLRRRPPLLPPGQPSGPPSGPHAAARRGRTAADPAQRASAAHREVPDRRRGGVRAGCPAVQPAGFLASVRRVGAGADALPPADRAAADHRRGLLPDLPGQSAVDLRGPAAARHRPLDHAVRADQPDRGGTAAGLPGLLPISPGSGLRAGRQHLRHNHRADPLDLVPLHHLRQVRLPTGTVSRWQGPNATAPAAQGLTDSRPWRLPAPGPVPQPPPACWSTASPVRPCSPAPLRWPRDWEQRIWGRASRTPSPRPWWPMPPSPRPGPRTTATLPARWYGLHWDPGSEVLVSTGAAEALAATILALVEPGDEVITLEPFYDQYAAMIALAGGVHRTVPIASRQSPGGDLVLDVD